MQRGTLSAANLGDIAKTAEGLKVLNNIIESFETLVLKLIKLCSDKNCPVEMVMWWGKTWWMDAACSVCGESKMGRVAKNIDKAVKGNGVRSPSELFDWRKAHPAGTLHDVVRLLHRVSSL
jgi:hypothetical protein